MEGSAANVSNSLQSLTLAMQQFRLTQGTLFMLFWIILSKIPHFYDPHLWYMGQYVIIMLCKTITLHYNY